MTVDNLTRGCYTFHAFSYVMSQIFRYLLQLSYIIFQDVGLHFPFFCVARVENHISGFVHEGHNRSLL